MSAIKYEVIIASPPDRDQVVAEIWIAGQMFAEVRREGDETVVEVYRPQDQAWVVTYKLLVSALLEASDRLVSHGG